jgi:hypothetical protein
MQGGEGILRILATKKMVTNGRHSLHFAIESSIGVL